MEFMGIEVPERVHISPLGYEFERVLLPAREYRADRVFLLEHNEPDSEKPEYHARLKTEFEESAIDVETIRCDLFDLYSVLGAIAEVITEHPSDEVYVNLSTGSKITAIGGMIACMVTREEVSVTPYYVRAEGYSRDTDAEDAPVSYGMSSISELPTYPIEGPSRDEIAMLGYIADQDYVSKKALIKLARGDLDRFARNAREKGIQPDDDPYMGEYRLLDTHVLEPLLVRECIVIEEVGRSKHVSVTDEGRNTLRAFEYLLNT